MKKCFALIQSLITKSLAFADTLSPHVVAWLFVGLRIWIALIFWKSGLTKIDNWDTTLFLFEEEYQVPLLPIGFAAFSATAVELIAPFLLVTGFATRIAAISLLFMTATIQFTYQTNHDHFLWALSLLALMLSGAGLYSWDYFIRQRFSKEKKPKAASRSGDSIGAISLLVAILVVGFLTIIAFHEALAALADGMDPWLGDLQNWWKALGK